MIIPAAETNIGVLKRSFEALDAAGAGSCQELQKSTHHYIA